MPGKTFIVSCRKMDVGGDGNTCFYHNEHGLQGNPDLGGGTVAAAEMSVALKEGTHRKVCCDRSHLLKGESSLLV